MNESRKQTSGLWIVFLLNLPSFLLQPFFWWWATTPTNVLNQGLKWLETLGGFSLTLSIPCGFVLGIIALFTLKRTPKTPPLRPLRLAVKIPAIANLLLGALEFGFVAYVFIAVAFFGLTH